MTGKAQVHSEELRFREVRTEWNAALRDRQTGAEWRAAEIEGDARSTAARELEPIGGDRSEGATDAITGEPGDRAPALAWKDLEGTESQAQRPRTRRRTRSAPKTRVVAR
jgi:hypothetical protein